MTDRDRIKYCRTCHDAGHDTDCRICPNGSGPELIPENHDAVELMQAVLTQWRGAGFGVIGLDYNTVYIEADRMEIDLTPCMMNKIRVLEMLELNRMNKRDE
jgi:hypothetical protein